MATARSARLQRRGLYAAVAVAVLLLAAYGLWPRPQSVELGSVARGPLQVLVREEGRTRVVERYRIAAPVDGQLGRIELEPGDPVHAGMALAELRPATSALLDPARRAAAESDWQAASEERTAAEAAVAAAAAERERSAAELERATQLAARGLIAAQSLEQLQAAARAAAAQAAAASARLRAANARMAQARAALDLAGHAAGTTDGSVVLTAPVDGVVLQRLRESAGPVRAGEVVLEIGDTGRIEAEIDVLSADAVRIAPGTPVRLHRWGGEQPLAGRVQRVEPGGFTKVSALGVEEQRVRVIVDVDVPASAPAGPAQEPSAQVHSPLGDGYRVEGEFVVWQDGDVLQVPASALFRDGDAWALYRLQDGRAQRVRVRIGHIGEQAAQVLGGIEAGAQVVLYPGEAIDDGTRIAAREAAAP